jgi:hypothetical protein
MDNVRYATIHADWYTGEIFGSPVEAIRLALGGMGIVVELETFVAGLLESVVETMSVNSLHLTSRDQICSAEITE